MTTQRTNVRFWMAAAVGLIVLIGGCRHLDSHQGGRFVWVERLEEGEGDPWAFRLHPGDTIMIEVWRQPDLSGERRVRSDGHITLPLVGDVSVVGLTPFEASERVREALLGVVRDPSVVVAVLDVRPVRIGVMGEVGSPGVYDLDRGSGVLHALAMAGGLTEHADTRRIFVVRDNGKGEPEKLPIRFDYRMLVQSRAPAAQFVLGPGDLVIVE